MPKFGTQNLRPSNDTVIFQRPSCGANIAVASGFIAGTAPVVQTMIHPQTPVYLLRCQRKQKYSQI